MRKFKFFALAFAAIAFAACSDDAIEGQSGSGGTLEDASPAYLNITFTANGGSSSRADDTNNGDEDGTIEDSGHENAGTNNETKVVTALVVVVPEDDTTEGTGFAKKYSTFSNYDSDQAGSATTVAPGNDDVLVVINDNNQTYSTDAPIEVLATAAGINYKVLVVVNPVDALTSNTSYNNINTGITDLATARSLYNDIITGNYSYTLTGGATEDGNTYSTAASQLGNGTSGFMMANKTECVESVTTANTPENPAEFELDVERVLSKITFRPQNMSTITSTPSTDPNYIYKVTSTIGTPVKAATIEAVYDDGITSPSANYVLATFNKATDLIGNPVYALYDENDELQGVYGDSGQDVEVGQTNAGKDIFVKLTPKTENDYESNSTNAYVAQKINNHAGEFTLADEAASITLEVNPDEEGTTTKDFWVKLEGYALINLSKAVNYVRHTIPVGGAVESPFGTLTTMNYYLWTPYWNEKNAVQFATEASGQTQVGDFVGTPAVGEWFYNTLASVSTQSKSLTVSSGSVNFAGQTYFKAMPTTNPENPGTVTGDGDDEDNAHTSANNNLQDIGYLLGYCFENSVETQQQRHGLTTGIAFVATMWKNEQCTEALDRLYLYAGNNFENIQQIVDAYAGQVSEDIKVLANKEAAGTAFTSEDLETMEAQGINRYEGNICYYYSSEIKHFDNGIDDQMGVMEFAIMRNNIYSLSVTDINDIGDPFVDPTPGTENESEVSAIVIRAKIMPWIVRYNDIEFN